MSFVIRTNEHKRKKTDLNKTHRAVALLPEAHPSKPSTAREEVSKRIFKLGNGSSGGGSGGEIADVECIDLKRWKV